MVVLHIFTKIIGWAWIVTFPDRLKRVCTLVLVCYVHNYDMKTMYTTSMYWYDVVCECVCVHTLFQSFHLFAWDQFLLCIWNRHILKYYILYVIRMLIATLPLQSDSCKVCAYVSVYNITLNCFICLQADECNN